MPLDAQQSERGLHLHIDLRPRVQVEYPCGHRWHHVTARVQGRAPYVCGRCYYDRAEWVQGELDPAWEVVPPPVVEEEPPPPAPVVRVTRDRIDASLEQIEAMVERDPLVPRKHYDRDRDRERTLASSTLMNHTGRTWVALVQRAGGRTPGNHWPRGSAAWEQAQAEALALIARMAWEGGRLPGRHEYDVRRLDEESVLPSGMTLANRNQTTWASICQRAAERRQRAREAA